MKSKIVTFLILLISAFLVTANGENMKLVITQSDGETTSLKLDDQPVVTFTADDLVATTQTNSHSFPLSEVSHISYKSSQQHVVVASGIVGGTITVDNPDAEAGETVTITVTPATDYQISKSDIVAEAIIDPGNAQAPGLKAEGPGVGMTIELTGEDPADLRQERTYTFTMPEAPYSVLITATFKGVTYFNVTVNPNIENGSVEADKNQAVEGETVTLTVTPATGYEIETLTYTVEGGETVPIENNKFNMPAANVTINATFKAIDYTITVAEGIENGTVEAPATAQYGQEVSVTVNPANGYELETLTYTVEGGEPMPIENNKFNMPAANVTINATFKKIEYHYATVEEVKCTVVDASGFAPEGQTITMRVVPDSGTQFKEAFVYKVSGHGQDLIEEPIQFTVTPVEGSSKDVDLSFVMPAGEVEVHVICADAYSITVDFGEHGSAQADKIVAVAGETVTVTTYPNQDYKVDDIYYTYVVDGEEQQGELTQVEGESNKYTFTMPAAAVNVVVTFKTILDYFKLKFDAAPTGGTVSVMANGDPVQPMGEVAEFMPVVVTVTPNENYEIESFKVYEGLISAEDDLTDAHEILYTIEEDGTYRFGMPRADATIIVSFKAIDYTITVAEGIENGTVEAPATAHYGQEVNVTVTPATGYVLETLTYTAEGGEPVPIENNKFNMPAANVTINATFKAIDYTITVAEGIENGTVEAPATAHYGQEVNVTVTPDEGYELDELVVMPAYNSVTCAEVIAGADDMIYRVSGKITHISSMEYGNLYLADNTGEIFIYGTLDKEGNTNNFESLGLKEGDYVIVEGPKTTYQGIVELIDVTVVGVEIETNVTGNGYTFTMPACDVVVSATFKSTSHTYTVAGEPAGLFGSETPWDIDNENAEMTPGENGLYTWTSEPTYLDGNVEFKIVQDGSFNTSYPASNYVINVPKPGTYTVTITFNPATGEITVNLEGQADVYVFGEINGSNTFAPNQGVKMTSEDGKIYTATITTADVENGYAFFAFTHKLGADANDWTTANAYRFLAQSNGNFLVTGPTMNVQLSIAYNGDNSMKIPAGEYTLTVDLENMNITITGGTQLSYILASGVEGVDYTVINDLAVVERHAGTKQFFTSDGNNNWITIKGGNFYDDASLMEALKGGHVSGVFSDKNMNPYLTLTVAPEQGENVAEVEPETYLLSGEFAPKVDEVIIISKAYYKASENALRAYSPGGAQGQSCTVDNSLYSYDFQDGKKYTVKGVINIKESWNSKADMMDYDYPFQNYKLLVIDVTEEDPTTSINGIYLEEGVKSVRFYNAAGVESNVPFQGINIVVKEMNDGSRVTSKVIIK